MMASPDLCVLTDSGAALYTTERASFRNKPPRNCPPGAYDKAVWIDYDHDYDLDLVLLGEQSKLVRNNGAAGFSDQTADFPFRAQAMPLSGATFELTADTGGVDLVVAYEIAPACSIATSWPASTRPCRSTACPRGRTQLCFRH